MQHYLSSFNLLSGHCDILHFNTDTMEAFTDHNKCLLKGGYLDFSHLTESKNIYIRNVFEKKKQQQYKSSLTKNRQLKEHISF